MRIESFVKERESSSSRMECSEDFEWIVSLLLSSPASESDGDGLVLNAGFEEFGGVSDERGDCSGNQGN